MTPNTTLIFEWNATFTDGQRLEGLKARVRARDAVNGGVPVPRELPTAAAVLRDGALVERAVRRVREEFGLEDNVRLECKPAPRVNGMAGGPTRTCTHAHVPRNAREQILVVHALPGH